MNVSKEGLWPLCHVAMVKNRQTYRQFYLHLRPLIHHGISAPQFLGDEAKRGLRFCTLFRFGGEGFSHQAVLPLQWGVLQLNSILTSST